MNVERMTVTDLLTHGAPLAGKIKREFMAALTKERYNELWGRML